MNQLTDSYTLHNGVQIPCVGFGTWKTPDGDVAENSVRTAIEAGYRHIDTATLIPPPFTATRPAWAGESGLPA